MNIGDLKLNPSNPRNISKEKLDKLKKSIKGFPKMMSLRPIIYDPKTMEVLGGNMRLQALIDLGHKELPDNWVKSAEDLTKQEKQEFIIKDNVGFGEWDWDILQSDWDNDLLENWGLDLIGFDVNQDEYNTDFSLKDGDKEPFQQITFTLADEQATQVQNAIADIKQTEEYKYTETMGNENSNGNALYLIIMQWAEQKK